MQNTVWALRQTTHVKHTRAAYTIWHAAWHGAARRSATVRAPSPGGKTRFLRGAAPPPCGFGATATPAGT
eukprot:6822844-Lingulodinium_polyedra.AAC.1